MDHNKPTHPKIEHARESAEQHRRALQDLCASKDQPIGLNGLVEGTKVLYVEYKHISEAQPSVIDCKALMWESDCPREVGGLQATDTEGKFFCPKCEQDVHWVSNRKDRNTLAQLGKNIAFAVDRPVENHTARQADMPSSVGNIDSDKYGLGLIRSILNDNTSIRLARLQQHEVNLATLKRLVAKLRRFEAQIKHLVRDPETGLLLSEAQIFAIESPLEQELALKQSLLGQSVLLMLRQLPTLEREIAERLGLADHPRPTTGASDIPCSILQFPLS